jgi:hypothetical protein
MPPLVCGKNSKIDGMGNYTQLVNLLPYGMFLPEID